ncbi:MAG: Ig-like domain-containing protein [Flavobacteriales bacterium]|nr:Ig-like domain-containing protein [Flavobacteriales bacterium]
MRKALLPVSIILLFGCAQQVAPTGGPKDETPPKILSETPVNLSTDFDSKQIVISFDEFIQLKSPAEQVVISPPMMKSPSYQLKQKSLVVKFEQELSPNTTYTINFGKAIADNNEANVLENYTYVFSTGSHLDSMQVKGKLVDAITGEPEKDALVMLYKNDSDSLPIDTIPDYFTRSLQDGSFLIKHVGNQPYKIFALKDENANYKFDSREEKIGFLDSLILPYAPPITVAPDTTASDLTAVVVIDSVATDTVIALKKMVGPTTPSYEMKMFLETDTSQFLKKSYCDYFGKLVFVYNRPVENLNIQMKGGYYKKEWMLKDYSSTGDTITIWTTDEVPDTLRLLLDAGKAEMDTVELTMKERTDELEVSGGSSGKGAMKKRKEKFALTGKFNPPQGRSPKPETLLSLVWNHPVTGMDLSRIKLYEDSVRVKYDINSTDPALRKFDITYAWKKGKNYRLLVLDSAFTDLYQLWNDTLETSFVGIDKEAFGELSLKITEAPKTQVVVELLNSANVVLDRKSITDKGVVLFGRLDPGKYHVQVVRDLNGNGMWDSGRYTQKRQPEPIKIIQKDSEVRANWNMELEWNPNESELLGY